MRPMTRARIQSCGRRQSMFANELLSIITNWGMNTRSRFELPPGSSDMPDFHFPATLPPEFESVLPSLESRVPVHGLSEDHFPATKRRIPFFAMVTAFVLIAASITFWNLGYSGNRHKTLVTASGTFVPMGDALTRFWRPILAQTTPILICIKDPDSETGGSGNAWDDPSLADAIATARLTGFIGGQGRAFELKKRKLNQLGGFTAGTDDYRRRFR